MKRLGKYLVLAGLLGLAGCVSDGKRTAAVKAKTDPAADEAPIPVVKVLAPDDLNKANANEQADAQFKALMNERQEIGQSGTASNGTGQSMPK